MVAAMDRALVTACCSCYCSGGVALFDRGYRDRSHPEDVPDPKIAKSRCGLERFIRPGLFLAR
jgi:hypothetical protein